MALQVVFPSKEIADDIDFLRRLRAFLEGPPPAITYVLSRQVTFEDGVTVTGPES